jgi:L-fuculose-phosphate aldolase
MLPMTDFAAYDEQQIRIDTIKAARLIWQRGFVRGTAGNVSVRLGASDKLLITPSNTPYANLKPDDLALCSMGCEHLAGEICPSIELPLHTAVYCARPDVRAIIHTHAPHATSIAAAGKAIPLHSKAARETLGSDCIPCTTFAPEGSTELANNVVAALGDKCKAVLLAKHGTLAVGSSLEEAFTISELIENTSEAFRHSKPTE